MSQAEGTVMGPQFWERFWRSAGIQFVGLFVIAFVIYGSQPKVGASAADLVSFYDGDRTRILIATVIFGLAVLNLMWFAAALSSTLRDAGVGGWGAAATASSAVLGTVFLVLMAVNAVLAYSVAGSGSDTLASGLNDTAWVFAALASFPAAMLIMAGTFGLRRAEMISNSSFVAGVAAVVLVLLGGTTWARDGIWALDGAYSRFISPSIALVWITVISGLLYTKSGSTARAPSRAAVMAP